ncbi:MarR family winged helix-turn-helix transcriptional regulator [Aliarcobacter vitoriensis]|uniref:MarR family winged helix-turn-helix transcriptional regulator n=1 Tax=Aliarcobacter vitoriensis TaxID=2011099 RepID=UPI000DEA42CE|nr:MarR family transcriptional regulator [Arcobacter sp. FW59]
MKLNQKTLCHCTNIRRTARKITSIYDNFLKNCELNVTQYSLLVNLKRVQPIKMNDFAEIVNLERTTLVRNLKPLINKDLIELQNIEKSKAKLLILTHKGLELQMDAQKYWDKAQNYIEQNIHKSNLEIFYETIQKIDSLEIKKKV